MDVRNLFSKLRDMKPSLSKTVVDVLVTNVNSNMVKDMSKDKLFELMYETALYQTTENGELEYQHLALRIQLYRLYQKTPEKFSDCIDTIAEHDCIFTGTNMNLLDPKFITFVRDNKNYLNSLVNTSKDLKLNTFGLETLKNKYLLRLSDKTIVERPQYLFMRVAIAFALARKDSHEKTLKYIKETYNDISDLKYTHATPTLFNAGTNRPQLASCFLQHMKGDSILDIYMTMAESAMISKHAGGIGMNIHNIRADGTYIKGTGGHSNGIVPMCKVFNETARYVDQGGGKRNGSIAMYLEPWHGDIIAFLHMRKNNTPNDLAARDLFLALWMPDLFYKRIKNNEQWSLFCPHEAPGLSDVYGEEFETLYCKYEKRKKFRKQISARELWKEIISVKMETGLPYIVNKDHCNKKSNHKHLGTIKSSNLCAEIVEFTSPDEVAVCNLASMNLSYFVQKQNDQNKVFNFEDFAKTVKKVTRNLNRVININYYPIEEAKNSNMKHRPIGIGVQGFADTLLMMRYPWSSKEAKQFNKDVFETMYYAAMEASIELAEEDERKTGKPGYYASFPGSPLSKGQFQFDLWDVKPSNRYDWDALRKRVMKSGAKNSLLIALMPTASTSQILGNNECFEPFTSNLYVRQTNSGQHIIYNKHLIKYLKKNGYWYKGIVDDLIKHDGSVQWMSNLPVAGKELFKTSWEMTSKTSKGVEVPNRVLLEFSADRAPFVCQSQSLNTYIANPNMGKISKVLLYAWQIGLKTGNYYMHFTTKGAVKFAVKTNTNKTECLSCGS